MGTWQMKPKNLDFLKSHAAHGRLKLRAASGQLHGRHGGIRDHEEQQGLEVRRSPPR